MGERSALQTLALLEFCLMNPFSFSVPFAFIGPALRFIYVGVAGRERVHPVPYALSFIENINSLACLFRVDYDHSTPAPECVVV